MSTQKVLRRMDSLDVHGEGRVTIPDDVRNEHGLVEKQLVPLRLVGAGDEELDDPEHFNSRLISKGRVRIPHRLREKHGIEDGDTADVELVEW